MSGQFRNRPLCHREKSPQLGVACRRGPRAGLGAVEEEKSAALSPVERGVSDRASRSLATIPEMYIYDTT